MHIQPQYIPIADLRFAPPSHIDRVPVQETQVIMATVLSRSDGGLVRLLINDLQVDVQLPLLVQRGQQIPLKLTEVNGKQMLEIPTEFLESYNPVATSLRQSLPKQASMQEAMPKLFELLSKENMPAHLQKAITQLQGQLPKIDMLFRGEGVKNAILNSGLFLERKLQADPSSRQNTQQHARANRNSQDPVLVEAFKQDIKANLWRLLQHLTQLAPRDSKLKGEILEDNQAPSTNKNALPTEEGVPQNHQGAIKKNSPDVLAKILRDFSLATANPKLLKTVAADTQSANATMRNTSSSISMQRPIASLLPDVDNTAHLERNLRPLTDGLSQASQQLPPRGLTPSTSFGNPLSKAILAFIETANLAAMGKAQPQQSRMENPNHLSSLPTKNQIAPDHAGQTPPLKDTSTANPTSTELAGNRNVFSQRNAASTAALAMPKSMAAEQSDSSSLSRMESPNHLSSAPTKNQIAPDHAGQTPPLKDTSTAHPTSAELAGNRNVFSQRNATSTVDLAMPKSMAAEQSDSSSLTITARQLVEAALGRIELTQLASLPRGNTQHIFTEIIANHPFLWVIPLQIRIDRDAKEHDGEMAVPHWSVALTLDLGDLGRMDALLWQEKTAVSASLWTEKPETRTLLRERLPLLQSFLQEAGVAVGNLALHEGSAPIRADEPHVDANNLVNLFL